MSKGVIILHNLRSTHNVGAILRSAACFGDWRVVCTGHTPYPEVPDDNRLPHMRAKQTKAINKTALGAEEMLNISYEEDVTAVIKRLKHAGFQIVACEQATGATALPDWRPVPKTAVIFGNEPEGVDPDTLQLVDQVVQIPQAGRKESLNVAAAAAIFLYSWGQE